MNSVTFIKLRQHGPRLGIAAVVVGDDQALRRLRARIDQRSAAIDLKIGVTCGPRRYTVQRS